MIYRNVSEEPRVQRDRYSGTAFLFERKPTVNRFTDVDDFDPNHFEFDQFTANMSDRFFHDHFRQRQYRSAKHRTCISH